MSEPNTPFSSKLFQLLALGERIFLGATIAALLLRRLEMTIEGLLPLAMVGLAIIYFLMAYRPPERTNDESEEGVPKLGFLDLLVGTIAPKVGWIGCAVSIIGILFSFQGNTGGEQMLMLGGGTLLIVSLLLTYSLISGNKTVTLLLMRTVPLCLICGVLLSKSGFFN